MFKLFLVVVSLALVVPCSARSQASTPDPTEPPPTQHAVATLLGRGVQIYVCQQAGKRFQWQFVAPAARLFTTGADGEREVGTHGDGPVWINQDGSSVRGKLLAKAASPIAGAVPWLLLQAVAPAGDGIFSGIEMIRRSETQGGLAPVEGCDAAHTGEMARVPYTATYTFYSSR